MPRSRSPHPHRFRPTTESLEGRALLSISAPGSESIRIQRASAIVATSGSRASSSNDPATRVILSAQARDRSGGKALTYTWSVGAMPDGAPAPVFSDNGTRTSRHISAILSSSGTYQFNVTITSTSNSASVQKARRSVRVSVAPRATRLVIQPPSTTMVVGESQRLTASMVDQFGRPIGRVRSLIWKASVGRINRAGQYLAPTSPTTAIISARSGSKTASIAIPIVPRNSAPTLPSIGFDSLGSFSARLNASADDDQGPSNLSWSWTTIAQPDGATAPRFNASDSPSTGVEFGRAGAYRFAVTVRDEGGLTATRTIDLVVSPVLSSLIVSPGSATFGMGQTGRFHATAIDQFGLPMPDQPPVQWSSSIGRIDSNGDYTSAQFSNEDVIVATAGGLSGSARAITINAPPTIVSIASDGDGPVTGTTTTLHAMAADDGDPSRLVYTWSLVSTPAGAPLPTFSTNGGNASGTSVVTFGQIGTYTFSLTVDDSDGGRTVRTVPVVVAPTTASMMIEPESLTLAVGRSQQLSVSAIDQFGRPIDNASIVWSASKGSINANGRYVAGSSVSEGTVTARIGSVSALSVIQPNYGLSQPAILAQFSTDYADGRIDRTDMIGLLNVAGLDGTVGQGDLDDLNTILNASASYEIPDFVKSLASSVVNGSVANGHYQGAPLGNLSAGSSSAQLIKLVNKWFLGADHPNPAVSYLNVTPTYAYASGVLFQSGPSSGDMKQGQVGDCYLIASLGAIARTNPSAITNMIVDNGDNTYTVRFFANGQPQYVTVDRYLPVDSSGRLVFANMGARANDSAGELWIPLIEKAYAQWYETGVSAPNNSGANAYASIDTGYLTAVDKHLIGAASSQTVWYDGSFASRASQIIARLNQPGVAVTAGTTAHPGGGLVGSHAYLVASYDASTGLFLLINPWGSSYPTVSLTASQMDRWITQVVAQDTTGSRPI